MAKTDDLGFGALIITEEMFKKANNSQMSRDEMADKMQRYAKKELEMLKCWYSGGVFGYIIERDRFNDEDYEHIPFASSVEIIDSGWGFFMLDGDYKTMFREMTAQLDDGTEIRTALAKQMLESIMDKE